MASSSRLTIVQVLVLLVLLLAAVPAGAHLFELLNKMALPPDQYMTVQRIYRGWALFGVVIFAALALTLTHAYLARRNAPALFWSLAAFLAILITQIVFWTWTYPVNVATENWSVMPQAFEEGRAQWEYSHAANAVITLCAFVFMGLAIFATRPIVRDR